MQLDWSANPTEARTSVVSFHHILCFLQSDSRQLADNLDCRNLVSSCGLRADICQRIQNHTPMLVAHIRMWITHHCKLTIQPCHFHAQPNHFRLSPLTWCHKHLQLLDREIELHLFTLIL